MKGLSKGSYDETFAGEDVYQVTLGAYRHQRLQWLPPISLFINYSKSCLKQSFKKDQRLIFKTNDRIMQVKSIAACSKRAYCNTFEAFVFPIFERPLKTGITVFYEK